MGPKSWATPSRNDFTRRGTGIVVDRAARRPTRSLRVSWVECRLGGSQSTKMLPQNSWLTVQLSRHWLLPTHRPGT